MGAGIRLAGAADAEAIAVVHTRSWDATYRGLLPDRVVDRPTVESRTAQWHKALDDGAVLFLATVGDRVVGFCAVSEEDGLGEVTAMYAVPDAWGAGHGRRMMVAALEWFRSRGAKAAILWVLDSNELGRSFYEKAGWVPDGVGKADDLFGARVNHMRYSIGL